MKQTTALNCAIALVVAVGAVAITWRVIEEDRLRRVEINRMGRHWHPSAPAWCYPEDGARPHGPDEKLRHLQECYTNIPIEPR